jgi:hypothetical protein
MRTTAAPLVARPRRCRQPLGLQGLNGAFFVVLLFLAGTPLLVGELGAPALLDLGACAAERRADPVAMQGCDR